MNERISKLAELTLAGKMYADTTKTAYDDADLLLPREERESKRICEYILNQEPKITEYSSMTGYFNFDGSVVGDAFRRDGHPSFQEAYNLFYCKPIDNLSTFEWQHATADYDKVLRKGISGIIREIDESLGAHDKPEDIAFLRALRRVAEALIGWAHKCSLRALEFSRKVECEEYKRNLERLSDALCVCPKTHPGIFTKRYFVYTFAFPPTPTALERLTDIFTHSTKKM